MKIGICSGSVFKDFKNDINKYISFCKINNIKYLEFTFKFFDELGDFKLSDEAFDYLKNCEIVSIHFPFKEKVNIKNKENIIIIENIYKKYKMNNITIHPNMIEDISLLDLENVNYSLENIKPEKEFDITKINKMLIKNPCLGFILDTTHAFHYNDTKIIELYDLFKDKIRFIHFSDLNHDLFRNSFGSRRIILKHLIKLVKKNDIPLMIETEGHDIEDNLSDFKIISKV